MKPKILGTGLSGMVGSRIIELLSDKYNFDDFSIERGDDIRKREIVFERVHHFPGEIVLHLAAKADVDACEKDKELGEEGDAWKVNVLGTKNLVDASQEYGKKLLYISTDFVFDGQNPPAGGYTEEAPSNPINWYARTKYEGEKLVQGMDNGWICRLAFPYRSYFEPKRDFVRAIVSRLQERKTIQAVTDQIITPTFIDDIVKALERLIESGTFGIYHLVGSQSLSPYEAARMIAKIFGQDENLVVGAKREEYFRGRAKRPFKLALKNDKISKLGVRMKSFEEGLREVKRQLL